MNEDILQAQLFKWYHNTFCTKLNEPRHAIFAVPNGGNRSAREAAKFRATGLVAGVSDMIVVQPNRVMFIEVKFDKGKQSQEQINFENTVKVLGFEYHIVRSLEEFKQVIQTL